jgi:hypothetical protein
MLCEANVYGVFDPWAWCFLLNEDRVRTHIFINCYDRISPELDGFRFFVSFLERELNLGGNNVLVTSF